MYMTNINFSDLYERERALVIAEWLNQWLLVSVQINRASSYHSLLFQRVFFPFLPCFLVWNVKLHAIFNSQCSPLTAFTILPSKTCLLMIPAEFPVVWILFLPPLREIAGKSHEIKFEFSPGGPRSILTECNRFTTYRSLSDEEFQRRLQIMPSLAEKNARKHQPACLSKSAAMISATNGRIDSQVINSPEERYITGE